MSEHEGWTPQPTTYKGIQMRSRLEARWAAFFDNIGWQWEYEPFQGRNYIPDFVIVGDDPFVVEVKPDTKLAELTQYAPRIKAALSGQWRHDFLIVGSTPFPTATTTTVCWDSTCHRPAGILAEWNDEYDFGDGITKASFDDAAGQWNGCGKCGEVAVIHDHQSYRCRPCGHGDGGHYVTAAPTTTIQAAWDAATNTVRWTPT
jgi:hypothetical protein